MGHLEGETAQGATYSGSIADETGGCGEIYCDTNGLSIMGHSGRINVGSNPSSRTEQLVEHLIPM